MIFHFHFWQHKMFDELIYKFHGNSREKFLLFMINFNFLFILVWIHPYHRDPPFDFVFSSRNIRYKKKKKKKKNEKIVVIFVCSFLGAVVALVDFVSQHFLMPSVICLEGCIQTKSKSNKKWNSSCKEDFHEWWHKPDIKEVFIDILWYEKATKK